MRRTLFFLAWFVTFTFAPTGPPERISFSRKPIRKRTLEVVRTFSGDTYHKECVNVPEFEFEGQRYQNPVELALHVIGGKWKMPILWRLRNRVWRYNELRRDLKRVSHKMLTQQLRELERAGLITRTVHPVVPPHVEYEITSLGLTTIRAIEALRAWGALYRKRQTP
jgi:DNA-binding HxlR family transcriptional regulator